MRLSSALILSILVHLIIVVVWVTESSRPVESTTMTALEAVDFDLGILAAQSESLVEKKASTKEQQASNAGSIASESAVDSVERQPVPEPETDITRIPTSQPEEASRGASELINPEAEAHSKTDVVSEKITKVKPAIKPEKTSPVKEKKLKQTKPSTKQTPLTARAGKEPVTKKIPEPEKHKSEPVVPPLKAEKAPAATELKVAKRQQVAGEQKLNAERSVKQVSDSRNEVSSGGKASSTQANNAQTASYMAGLKRRIANSANKLYPKKAKRHNQQGVVDIGFNLSKEGLIENITLVRECDYPSLNKAAVKAVKRIKKYKPRPEGVRSYVIVKVAFKIK